MKTVVWTILALVAFAANSILCRLALGEGVIDASSFTSIRLFSGIAMLVVISLVMQPKTLVAKPQGSWISAVALFIYAIAFSYAYTILDTGTGALILFSAVQITMILVGALQGNRPSRKEWVGLVISFVGFVYLVLPNVATPSLLGFVLMTMSGIAWAFYTLSGANSKNPLADTTYNFVRTFPLIVILVGSTISYMELSWKGVLLAGSSGAVASGLGYTIWYVALRKLSTVKAAITQLLVPVIATVGGVLFVDEVLSMRLVISSLLVLGGILLVIVSKREAVD